jgi:hypothetical protein
MRGEHVKSAETTAKGDPMPEKEDRDRTRALLQKNVERARTRVGADRDNGAKNEAYVKALIRYNEFLMEEKVMMHFQEKTHKMAG